MTQALTALAEKLAELKGIDYNSLHTNTVIEASKLQTLVTSHQKTKKELLEQCIQILCQPIEKFDSTSIYNHCQPYGFFQHGIHVQSSHLTKGV